MLNERLHELEVRGEPIRVGLIGAGTVGAQIIAQTCRMKGTRLSAIADLEPERAARALGLGGEDKEAIVCRTHCRESIAWVNLDRPMLKGSAP